MTLRSPLHAAHAALGATFTAFAGYDMPVHYGSITEEHLTVREGVGLFDVSHMSNLWVTGPDAAATLSAVMPYDFSKLPVGRCKYTVFLREDASILDDTIVSRTGEERYFVVPNAGQNEAAARHLRDNGDAKVEDVTRGWAILALQGPRAPDVYDAAVSAGGNGDGASAPPRPFRIHEATVAGAKVWASGTGYTGQKGCELFAHAGAAVPVWEALLAAGAAHGIRPIGLGARDTLRLEQGYCLAGNEFAGGRTPVEAGLSWLVDWNHDCLGMDALRAQRDGGDHDLLRGLVLERGVPRRGYSVLRDGARVGEVTSGTQSPSLGRGIALAYLRGVREGDEVDVEVRGRPMPARVVRPPFL